MKGYRDVAVGDDIELSSQDTPSMTTTVAGLPNGAPVCFTVTATTIVVSGPPTRSNTVVSFGTPFAPVDVCAESGDHLATVSWNPPPARPDGTPGNNGRDVTFYEIAVLSDTGLVRKLQVTPEPRSVIMGGLANGAPYRFTVRARNAAGLGEESGPSNPVIAAGRPFPPQSVTATESATRGAVQVSWVAPDVQPDGTPGDNGSPIADYTIVPSPACGGCGGTRAGTNAASTTVTGLSPGTTYTFTVAAGNAAGDSNASDPSNPVTIETEPLDVLTHVQAQGGDTQATLTYLGRGPEPSTHL